MNLRSVIARYEAISHDEQKSLDWKRLLRTSQWRYKQT